LPENASIQYCTPLTDLDIFYVTTGTTMLFQLLAILIADIADIYVRWKATAEKTVKSDAKRLHEAMTNVTYPLPAAKAKAFAKETERQIKNDYKLSKSELLRLHALLDLPDKIAVGGRLRVHSFEALLIVLRRLAYPCRRGDLVKQFGRSEEDISKIFNTTIRLIAQKYGKIIPFHMELYTKLRHEFARVIAEKNGMPRRAARLATVTGFVDGTVFGVGARGDDTRFWVTKSQETGINYLGIQWPNGLMGAMMGPYEGHKGDSKAWVDSGLGEFMARHPDFKDDIVWGDGGFNTASAFIWSSRRPRSEKSRLFDAFFRDLRVRVEHGFGILKNTFTYLTFPTG